MVKGIIESKMLIGKTKNEVIEMLGEDQVGYINPHNSDEYWQYYVGMTPDFLRLNDDDVDAFLIFFKDEIVTEVEFYFP